MLTVHLAKVTHVKRIFVAGLAGFEIDALDAAIHGVADQLLGRWGLIVTAMMGLLFQKLVDCAIHVNMMVFLEINAGVLIDESSCHNHDPSVSLGWSREEEVGLPRRRRVWG